VLKGAKYPSGTKRTAAGAVLTQFPGGAGDSVGRGLSLASGSEKSTVTLVSKAASALPGVGETDVIVKGAGGTVVVGLGFCPVRGTAGEEVWSGRCRAIRVPALARATIRTRPLTKPGTRQRRFWSVVRVRLTRPISGSPPRHLIVPSSTIGRAF
jgi:hypothetical protein